VILLRTLRLICSLAVLALASVTAPARVAASAASAASSAALSPPAPKAGVAPKARGPVSPQRTLILGDSITQDGRWVSFLEYLLDRAGVAGEWDVISIGLGSETVSGLSEPSHPQPRPCVLDRLDAALAAVRPARVLACYGMNDGIYHPPSPERRAAYLRGLTALRDRVQAAGATLVLITPPLFDALPIAKRLAKPDATTFGYQAPYAEYNAVLTEFADEALRLRGPGVDVIDLHRALLAELAERRRSDPAFTFSPDGVHPGALGHLVMARAIAPGLGIAVAPAEAADELRRVEADPRFTLIHQRRALRSEAWLPFVGYTRERAFKSGSVTATEAVVARLTAELKRP
jgi:lysophospholipase L1-like esterase